MDTFNAVNEARIDNTGGVPRLTINGKPELPLIFFHNTHVHIPSSHVGDITGTSIELYLNKQVTLARDAGVHIYSLPFGWPEREDGEPDIPLANGILDRFIKIDPQALFILRIYPGACDWGSVTKVPDEEIALFEDGTKGIISIASDYFWEPVNEQVLRPFIRYYEASEYGKRIISYHPCALGENFHQGFWDKGPDYSVANHRRFRQWLKNKYGTDAALRKAWGKDDVTLATAPIPKSAPGRYPMRSDTDPAGAMTPIFYNFPGEQDWIDFSTYENDIAADRLIDIAGVIKEETQRRKLVTIFYGYLFELHSSFVGHYRLNRLLECPDVDILTGPNSYFNRFSGGTMNYMSPVDSVSGHGKLWLNEDDSRTSLFNLKDLPHWAIAWESGACKSLDETLNTLDRNFGTMMVHRAGTWWMDLVAAGAFNDPTVWEVMKQRIPLFEKVYQNPTPFRGEVALIVDEESKIHVKDDWGTNFWTMINLRDECARSGATVGYYTLKDFLDGKIAGFGKVYVFANAFRLTDEQIDTIRMRLDHEGATAYWAYAPGYIGSDGMDVARSSRLTGIDLSVLDGAQGSEGLGLLAGESWGAESNQTQKPMATSPRLIVTDKKAEPLGHYKDGGEISAARIRTGNHTSIFVGDMGVTSQMLMRLFESAGVHIWTRDSSVLLTDSKVLMIHTGKGGLKEIHLPTGVSAEAIKGKIEKETGNVISSYFKEGETQWFKLNR